MVQELVLVVILHVPPVLTPPLVGELGTVGQGPVVPCGLNTLASKGSLDPAPLMVAGELPSHTGQPPHALATPKFSDMFKTPSTARSGVDLSRLTPGAGSDGARQAEINV